MLKKILDHLEDSLLKCNEDLVFIYQEEENQIQINNHKGYFATIVDDGIGDSGYVEYKIWTYLDTTEEGFELNDLIVLGELAKLVREIVN